MLIPPPVEQSASQSGRTSEVRQRLKLPTPLDPLDTRGWTVRVNSKPPIRLGGEREGATS